MRRTPNIQIQKVPGTLYPDLETAQARVTKLIAFDLAATVRSMLADGSLIVDANNRIIPNERTDTP